MYACITMYCIYIYIYDGVGWMVGMRNFMSMYILLCKVHSSSHIHVTWSLRSMWQVGSLDSFFLPLTRRRLRQSSLVDSAGGAPGSWTVLHCLYSNQYYIHPICTCVVGWQRISSLTSSILGGFSYTGRVLHKLLGGWRRFVAPGAYGAPCDM